jgi:hypothetical protein
MKADRRRHFAPEVEHHDTQHASLCASKRGPMDLHQASDGRAPPRLIAMLSVSSRSLWHSSWFHSPASGESEAEVEIPSAMTSPCSFILVPCARPILLTECTSGSLSSPLPLLSPFSLSPSVGDEAASSSKLEDGVANGVSPHMPVPDLTAPPVFRPSLRLQNERVLVPWPYYVLRPSSVLH